MSSSSATAFNTSSCKLIGQTNNGTRRFELEHGWEGIPFNFILNFCLFFVSDAGATRDGGLWLVLFGR